MKDILAAVVLSVLGHSDLSTTMIYTHIFDEEVESALKSFRQTAAVAGRVLGCSGNLPRRTAMLISS